MFVVPPFFPAIWVLRRLQARRPLDSFVSRHPLISLSGLVFVFGFVYDFAMEELCVRIGLYTFTQVIPFGSVFVGTRWQFPLAVAVLADQHSDDSGRSVDLSRRHRTYCRRAAGAACRSFCPTRPVLGSFLTMLVGVNLAFMTYGVVYTAVTRWFGAATSIVCPGPGRAPKFMTRRASTSRAAHRGPFSEGIWSTWESAQPRGRPLKRLSRMVVVALPLPLDCRTNSSDVVRKGY